MEAINIQFALAGDDNIKAGRARARIGGRPDARPTWVSVNKPCGAPAGIIRLVAWLGRGLLLAS